MKKLRRPLRQASATPPRKRVAFVRLGTVPEAQRFVVHQLRERFPEVQVDVVDIRAWLSRRPHELARLAASTIATYGLDVIGGRRKFRDALWRAPYLFDAVRRLMRARVSPSTHVFTFQMQSLFDASVPGVPNFVYTDHTNLANRGYATAPPGAVYPERWRASEREIYENAARLFVRSEHVRRSLTEDYGISSECVDTVYAGSNASVASHDTSLARYRARRVLFVGRDWKRKGGPDLLAAWSRVRAEVPDAKLTIIGASPRANLPRVEIVGPVPLDEVDTYYANSSIFCMPSHVEPFGVAYVEAMMHALPVVGPAIGAVPDLVEHGWNGYLVRPGDVEGIATALVALLRDPTMSRTFGHRSVARATERYSWDAVGNRIERSIRAHLASLDGQPPSG